VAQAGSRARARRWARGGLSSRGSALSTTTDGMPGIAEELRRRRTALGWTLEQVAAQAQVSVGMLSLIETGKRRPSVRSWERRMQVLDDGSHVQLAPAQRFHEAVAQLVQQERLPRLTQEQAEVLAIVIMDGMASRRRIEEVRGAATLSMGREGPVSLPRDSSETLALLLSRGLLCAERDDHANGRPLVYRPTLRLLQLLGTETLEEVRGKMATWPNYSS
jgi:chromosome segregation and condensation protein ScpB